MRSNIRTLAAVVVLFANSATCLAQEAFYAISDRFSYTGTVTVYNTLQDAQDEVNARFTGAIPLRVGSLFIVRNAPDVYSDANILLTAWYLNGGQNPFNTNVGFLQMYDLDASQWQNQKAYWSKDLKTFTVRAKGKNVTYGAPGDPLDYARFWNAGAPAGSGESTKGTFLKYDYSLTAVFDNEATDNNTGIFKNTGDAVAYAGHMKAVFRNESVNYPASNGFYVIDMVFNKDFDTTGYDVGSDLFASKNVHGRG